LLDHPLLSKFFDDTRENILRKFNAADYKDVEELQNIRLELYVLDAFKQYLEDYKRNGALASSILTSHEMTS
jgi:hypothetical protein